MAGISNGPNFGGTLLDGRIDASTGSGLTEEICAVLVAGFSSTALASVTLAPK